MRCFKKTHDLFKNYFFLIIYVRYFSITFRVIYKIYEIVYISI